MSKTMQTAPAPEKCQDPAPGRGRVLIVDDDPRIGEKLQCRLTSHGYEVVLSRSRCHAVDHLREISPQYILLDVMLGDGLGYDVARNVRRDNLLYKVPILFQSVAGDETDIRHAFEQGGDSYITKPYSEQDLLVQLNNLEHLRESIESRCPITDFHTLNALRREVDHLLFRQEQFALLYVFMKGIDNLHHSRDLNVLKRMAFITGKTITHTIKTNGFYETYSCHLGGGYFMIKVKYDDYKRFRKLVREDFATRQEEIEGAGLQPHLVDAGDSPHSRYQLLAGITHTQRAKFRCANQMFETLHKVEKISKKKSRKITDAARRLGGHNHWVD